MSVLHAFSDEALAIEQTLADVAPQDWVEPGLGDWTIAELFAHTIRAAVLIDRYLDLPAGGDTAAHDRVSYFAFDHAGAANSIAQRARDEAAKISPGRLPAMFADGWRRSLERAVTLPETHLMHSIRGPMELHEYAATRVLELTIQHMDLRRALGHDPAPSETGLAVTAGVLDGLLAGPRPTDAADDITFVLAATGRAPSTDKRLPLFT